VPLHTVNLILLGLWLVFIGYWTLSAFGVKKDVKRSGTWGTTILVRLAVIAIITYWLNQGSMRPTLTRLSALTDHPSLIVQILGIALTAAGVAFAIWARVHLGRNWSPVPALKEEHELITSGPYRYVRNPIYTGILFATLGSALAGGLMLFIVFLVCLVAFVYRVFAEDRLMMQQFPNSYPEYRRRTKALIPYIV
jgi:protein-S-isoprenylcysteine O-methyltransferase Ste14